MWTIVACFYFFQAFFLGSSTFCNTFKKAVFSSPVLSVSISDRLYRKAVPGTCCIYIFSFFQTAFLSPVLSMFLFQAVFISKVVHAAFMTFFFLNSICITCFIHVSISGCFPFGSSATLHYFKKSSISIAYLFCLFCFVLGHHFHWAVVMYVSFHEEGPSVRKISSSPASSPSDYFRSNWEVPAVDQDHILGKRHTGLACWFQLQFISSRFYWEVNDLLDFSVVCFLFTTSLFCFFFF